MNSDRDFVRRRNISSVCSMDIDRERDTNRHSGQDYRVTGTDRDSDTAKHGITRRISYWAENLDSK